MKGQSEQTKDKRSESAAMTPGKHLGAMLAGHAKIISILIIVMMALPIAAVGLQVSPQLRTLPAAPDFRMMNVETGSQMRLSDYDDKVVLIDFMATWCEACKESMQDLVEISDRYYSTLSFVMLSVTTYFDDNVSEMRDFKDYYSANWTFAIPMFMVAVGTDYGVSGYPTYVIVDRDGQIAYRSIGLTPLSTLISTIDEALES